ncbi:hypothetical protein GOP47_0019817 [Adiantum capillus-veneris]|uniref:Protein kinase domain-containing protein n=1 Tax=Adiantum capillus-veneris TaxID=13818 RepID=A0A9D4Z8Z3_ADICA|nr:hypothetical protein GOP47_0019817 [Adiantum capillus-veneris]
MLPWRRVPLCYCHLCPETCGHTVIPYPFGLGKCGLPAFQLQCNDQSQLLVWLNKTDFRVLSITSQTIAINPMREFSCGYANIEFFNFIGESNYAIPGSSYNISRRNALMMYKCDPSSSCSCDIQPGFDGASNLERVYNCPRRYCCGSLQDHSLLSLMRNCTSFVSWTLHSQPINLLIPVQIQVQYGLELEAWVPGPCTCAANAKCNLSDDGRSHQCHCENGLVGDGFATGLGCHANVSSCRHESFVGCTRNLVLLSAGLTAGTIIVVVSILAIILLHRRKRAFQDVQSRRDIKQIEGLLCNHSVTKVFAYKDLEKATKGFCDQYKLGNGAFGTVYAGKLSDGRLVAVKRINYRYMQGIQQVVNEVKVLTAVKHQNLVQLLGCCLEYGDPLLVYEYVPNGTLAEHLQKVRGTHLTWSRRVNIATETAQALTYLHSLDPPIYHRDVKSSNILLDLNFTSKVADFGLSRLIFTENSHISTVPQGTPGYLDPQYQQSFHLSEKSDVYSFGVVLVEIMTALKVVDFTRDKSEVNLANLALARIGNGTLDDVIDPSLEAGKNPQVRAMIQVVAEIAYRCLSYDKDARPTIKEVFQELEFVRNETRKSKVPRLSFDRSRSQLWNSRKESSARIQSVSCSSADESRESSFRTA